MGVFLYWLIEMHYVSDRAPFFVQALRLTVAIAGGIFVYGVSAFVFRP